MNMTTHTHTLATRVERFPDRAAPRPRTAWTARVAMGLACLGAVMGGGCIGPRNSAGSTLRASDFVASGDTGPDPVNEPPVARPGNDGNNDGNKGPTLRTGPVAASEGMFDVTGMVGTPDLDPREPAASEGPVLVDGVVGYINNRAIYISDFLAPMEQRFRAESRKLARDKWIKSCREQIQFGLNTLIEDELLRAEALSSLTPEQKQGFFNVVRQIQSDFISKNYGVRAVADETLRNKEGVSKSGVSPEDQDIVKNATTVDQYTKAKEEQELITYQLSRQIYRRLNVSWRDIQLGYEKQFDVFNPPPAAQFRLISVDTKATEKAARVRDALAAGTDFADVAATPDNSYNPDEGGLWRRTFEKDFETTEFFGVPALNEKAHTLKPGEWAGPIDAGSSAFWLKLERIDRRTMGLYDAQLAVERELQNKRAHEARTRYIDRLKQRASFTSIDEMTDRLLRVAVERYSPTGKAAAGAKPSQPGLPGSSDK